MIIWYNLIWMAKNKRTVELGTNKIVRDEPIIQIHIHWPKKVGESLKGNKAPIENYSLGYLYWNNNSKSNASNRKKHSGWKMGDILRRLPWPWPYHGARDAINIKTSLKSTLLMDVNGIQYVKKKWFYIPSFHALNDISNLFHPASMWTLEASRTTSYHHEPTMSKNARKKTGRQKKGKKNNSWQADKNYDDNDNPYEFWIYPTRRETQKRIHGKSQLCLWAREANPASVAFQCAWTHPWLQKHCAKHGSVDVFSHVGPTMWTVSVQNPPNKAIAIFLNSCSHANL